MLTVALIPARGGSKRFPRKNIYKLSGLPLIAYAIRTAQLSGIFSKVIVSTEDAEIAKISKRFGAEVIDRPSEIAQDKSSVIEVCLNALDRFPDIGQLCCIYATAILLKPDSIVASYKLFNNSDDVDFVMGVSKYSYPPVQALKANEKGYLSYMWPEWKNVQSQCQPELLVSNGTFYWARRAALLQEKTFYGARLRGYIVPEDEVSDINTFEDLSVVSRKLDCKISKLTDWDTEI